MNSNNRGIAFMILAMAFFSVEDMFIKAAAGNLPLGQILLLFGIGGMIVFSVLALVKGQPLLHPAAISRVQLIRSCFEVAGRLFFALAIILSPLSSASAILQATPIVVVIGGILFFGERVQTVHWLAIIAGLVGVLMIIRPGVDSFNPASIFAALSTIGFAGRDLASRAAPPSLSNIQLGIYGFFMLVISGLILQFWYREPVNLTPLLTTSAGLQVLGAIVFGTAAYQFLMNAMRTGDIKSVTPFRYTRLVFAMMLGIAVFGERPDTVTLLGSLIIVLSGIAILWLSKVPSKETLRPVDIKSH